MTRVGDHVAGPLRIVVLSDTHVPVPGSPPKPVDPVERARRLVEAAADWRPDLLVLAGDIVDGGNGESVADHERQLAWLAEVIETIGLPVVAAAGNHDRPELVADVFPSEWEGLGHRVVTVDTTVAGASSGRWPQIPRGATVLVGHHPLRSHSTHPMFQAERTDDALREATDAGVRLVVSGHLHEAFVDLNGPVALVGAASTAFGVHHNGDEWTIDPTVPSGATTLELPKHGAPTVGLLT